MLTSRVLTVRGYGYVTLLHGNCEMILKISTIIISRICGEESEILLTQWKSRLESQSVHFCWWQSGKYSIYHMRRERRGRETLLPFVAGGQLKSIFNFYSLRSRWSSETDTRISALLSILKYPFHSIEVVLNQHKLNISSSTEWTLDSSHLCIRTNYILSAQHCSHYMAADSIVDLLIQIFHHLQLDLSDSVDSVAECRCYTLSNNDSI